MPRYGYVHMVHFWNSFIVWNHLTSSISSNHLAKIYGRPSLLSSPGQPPFTGLLISSIAPKGSVAHFCWSHSAVSCCFMQITIWNQSGNRVNHYPACKCNLKSLTLCSWEQQSYSGATWTSIEDNHIKRWSFPSTHLEAEEFFLSCPESGWIWSGELDALSLSAWSKRV